LNNALGFARIWIFLATTLCAGSWGLSLLHAFNGKGYIGLLAVQIVCLTVWGRLEGWNLHASRIIFEKAARRLRKPLPLIFAVICAISFLGGIMNPVTNGDTLTYRIPRLLHWFSENRWHWIHAADERVNGIGMDYEFLAGPAVLLNLDRFGFLPSFTAYLLLPGLTFSFLREMRVRPKSAWWWSWLLPTGWIFAIQASSFATDSFSATPALAAILFALRARRTGLSLDVWTSILAIGLLTGTKQTTLPLGLVWLPAVLAAWRPAVRRLPGTIAACLIGIAASAIPITILNLHYAHNWKGLNATSFSWEQSNPFWGLVGNLFIVAVQSFYLPLFPWAPAWNDAMARFVNSEAGRRFSDFETFGHLGRSPTELNASLGFGITLIFLASLVWLKRRGRGVRAQADWLIHCVRWFPFISAAVFLSRSALPDPTRYIAPYYPLFLPAFLLLPGNSRLVLQRWFQKAACASAWITVAVLLMSRQRPLFPAYALAAKLEQSFPNKPFFGKVRRSFSFVHQDEEARRILREYIPPDVTVVGYYCIRASLEYVVWRIGSVKRVYRFGPGDTSDRARELGVQYMVVDISPFEREQNRSDPAHIAGWLKQFPGEIIAKIPMRKMPDWDPDPYYIIKLDPPK
jgi:hypothetical protein